MTPVPTVDTFKKALETDGREHGHIYCLFECEHWVPACVGVAKRVGFDEYIKNWSIPDFGAHCRCVYEDEAPAFYICEECPLCRAKQTDLSPTPWDSSTWGYYCDRCEKFFDLVTEGYVLADAKDYVSYRHGECDQQARYIGYLRDGEPCNHPGCLSHVSHPCEGCGRIAGRDPAACRSCGGLQQHKAGCREVRWLED